VNAAGQEVLSYHSRMLDSTGAASMNGGGDCLMDDSSFISLCRASLLAIPCWVHFAGGEGIIELDDLVGSSGIRERERKRRLGRQGVKEVFPKEKEK